MVVADERRGRIARRGNCRCKAQLRLPIMVGTRGCAISRAWRKSISGSPRPPERFKPSNSRLFSLSSARPATQSVDSHSSHVIHACRIGSPGSVFRLVTVARAWRKCVHVFPPSGNGFGTEGASPPQSSAAFYWSNQFSFRPNDGSKRREIGRLEHRSTRNTTYPVMKEPESGQNVVQWLPNFPRLRGNNPRRA